MITNEQKRFFGTSLKRREILKREPITLWHFEALVNMIRETIAAQAGSGERLWERGWRQLDAAAKAKAEAERIPF